MKAIHGNRTITIVKILAIVVLLVIVVYVVGVLLATATHHGGVR